MNLYEQWIRVAYDNKGQIDKKLWDRYTPAEQKIYEELLEQKLTHICGTVTELAERFHVSPIFICGFLDGINDAVQSPVEIKELTEDTPVSIDFEFEALYKKMVEYKAEHLVALPQWYDIFDEETRKRLYIEQRQSTTFVREAPKVGRNDPCPCGSGKKYKKCCGLS